MAARIKLTKACFRAFELLTGAKALDAGACIDFAWRTSGLADVSLDDVAEPLECFLHACEEEARLSALGRFVTRWDVHRLLSNLLRLRAEERRAPAIRNEPVEEPIFITGTPRSATTFLHRLIAEDEACQSPRCWQTVFPYPDSSRPGQPDTRSRRVGTQLNLFAALCPEIRSVQPIYSESPQECTDITAHVFQSLRFDTSYEVPTYRRWLTRFGHVQAYRFHKTFLQHLQRQSEGVRRRWVLKCPDHVFALDALRQVYPDARLVFVHRDPLKVIPSVARLTELLRTPLTRRVDRRQIGRQVVEDWYRGCAIMMDMEKVAPSASWRVIHLNYADVVASPLDAVQRIYSCFGVPIVDGALARMAQYVARMPRGGYGLNLYRLADYGINENEVRERFRPYLAHFGIPAESQPGGAAN